MSFTFATLKTAIQDYTENTDTTFVSNLNKHCSVLEAILIS